MILKTANIAYLFDFDGTLVGSDDWKGFFSNTMLALKKPPYFNPDKLDIRWYILTARPKIDYYPLRFICGWHGMHPGEIYTSNTLRYKFKDTEDEMKYKRSFIESILNGKRKLPQYSHPIEKVLYIDNNNKANNLLNAMKGELSYLALTVQDFYTDKFYYVL